MNNAMKITMAVVVALGLLALGLCIRSGLRAIPDSQRTVDVRGLATREDPANRVTWPIVFKQVGNDLPTVYEQVSSTNDAIVKYLKDNGISDSDISISAPSMTDLTTDRYNTQPIPYNYSVRPNSIKPEMIAEATKNAREAANKFAEDSESKLGKIKSAYQGQFSIEDRDNYTPYIKTVRVVTTLTYFLED